MRFRRYPDESGDRKKYLSYQGEEGRIYNTEAFDRGSGQGFICITEGEFDAIAATSAGLPAVGIPGANSWCDYFWRAFRNYPTIYVLTDGDSPGDKLGDAIARSCQNVRVLKMPAGEDVNSFYLKEGGHGLRQFLGL